VITALLGLPHFRRVGGAVASNGLTQVLGAGQALILLPLFLRAWGAEEYGRWLALSAGVYYLALLDFGGQTYIGNLLTMAHARGERDTFRARLSEGVSLSLAVSGAAWVVATAIILAIGSSFGGETSALLGRSQVPWILLALATTLLLTVPAGVLATVYRATGRFTRGAMIANAFRAFELVALAGVLIGRGTPLQYAVTTLVLTVIRTAVLLRDLLRCVPEVRGIKISLSLAMHGRVHVPGSLLFWVYALAGAVNQQGILLALAATSGPLAVAAFTTHRTVSGLVGYVPILFYGPLQPELARLWATGRRDSLARLALVMVRVVMVTSGLLALAMFVAMPIVYPAWTGRALPYQSTLLLVLLTQAFLAAGWATSAWAPLAGNRHQAIAYWSIANAALTILLVLVLSPALGPTGAALGTLGADLAFGLLVFPFIAARFLDVPIGKVARSIMWPALLIGVPASLSSLAYRMFTGTPLLLSLGLILVALSIGVLAMIRGSAHALRIKQAV
jgi:O-antigen/teichoic acid export membrane protein